MRRPSALLAAAVLLAGCGGGADRASAPEPGRVFTVPAKLPPPERHVTAPGRRVASPAAAPQGPPSDAQVRAELARALGVPDSERVADTASLTAGGLATVPPAAPAKVAAVIAAANQVARAPYRYGGGHGGVKGSEVWIDTAYDCSGSVSFALASAGLVDRQLDSTSFETWGRPGPGRWVTVYANAGHAFMVVAGLRFDTVQRAETGTRWGPPPTRVEGFVARHPPGL